MFIPAMPIADLLPGDAIIALDFEITVDKIEPLDHELIRVYGRITKGHGTSHRPQRWTRVATEAVDIERTP